MNDKLSPEFLKAFTEKSVRLGYEPSEVVSERQKILEEIEKINKKITASQTVGIGNTRELTEARSSLYLKLSQSQPVATEETDLAEGKQPEYKVEIPGHGFYTVNARNEKEAIVRAARKLKIDPKLAKELAGKMGKSKPKVKKLSEEVELEEASGMCPVTKAVDNASTVKDLEALLKKHNKKDLDNAAQNISGMWFDDMLSDYRKRGYSESNTYDEIDLVEARSIDMKSVEALAKIKDLGELKTKASEIIKGSGARDQKKAALVNSISKASSTDKVLSIVWNVVLSGDKLGTVGSDWNKRMESVELDEALINKFEKMMGKSVKPGRLNYKGYPFDLSDSDGSYLEITAVDFDAAQELKKEFKKAGFKVISDSKTSMTLTESVELDEGLDPVNKKAVKKDFDDRKDKDLDNDGDTDDSDEYLHKRRKAISRAVEEAVQLRIKGEKE